MGTYYYPFESQETGDESNPYDRAITAEEERMFNKLRYVNGVFNPDGGSLLVTANSNMMVTVAPGGCHVEGALFYNDSPITLTLEAANSTLNRIDRIVAQFNTSQSVRAINIVVRTGTAATNPIPPEVRTESNLYEIVLADVYVGKNVSSIGTANITDQRMNSELCGQVVPAIPTPLDLDGIYNQYQASLNDYLELVASALDETTAGNLQNQITALETAKENAFDILSLIKGGTGANNRKDAISNLITLPTNTVPTEDTPSAWAALGNCVIYFNTSSTIINKPSAYGIMIQTVHGNFLTQHWSHQGYSVHEYTRMGNVSNGWNQNGTGAADAWREVVTIVAEGTTTNGWRWTKWSDGTVDQWYYGSRSFPATSASGNIYYRSCTAFQYPIAISEVLYANVDLPDGYIRWASAFVSLSNGTVRADIMQSSSSSAADIPVAIHIKGIYE